MYFVRFAPHAPGVVGVGWEKACDPFEAFRGIVSCARTGIYGAPILVMPKV